MRRFATKRLGEVARLLSGGTPRKTNAALWAPEVPWLTPKDMREWKGTTEESVARAAIGNGTRLGPAAATYVAVRGMSLHNEIRVIRSDRPIAFNQDVKAVVARDGTDPHFLYYAITAAKPQLLEWVSSSGHGTGVLETDRLLSLQVPDISEPEQGTLGQYFCDLDDKIELNRRMKGTLEAMAQAIFRDWFVDFGPVRRKMEGATDPIAIMGGLTPDPAHAAELAALFPGMLAENGLPEGWSERPLDKVAEFLNGLALQKYPAAKGEPSLPVIKIAELRNGLTDKSGRASMRLPEKYIVRDGDYLFSWSGSLMAKIWTEGDGALNQHLFKVSSSLYPQWFYAAWVEHHLAVFQQIAASKATTMGHIQRGHLSSAMTVCPPKDALDIMSTALAPLWERRIHNDLENRTLAETRDYLLPRLMSGEVTVGGLDRSEAA